MSRAPFHSTPATFVAGAIALLACACGGEQQVPAAAPPPPPVEPAGRANMQPATSELPNTPTATRGALDATGHDETGWAHDRRVDVTTAP